MIKFDRHRGNRGFTLMEVLITIAIIGVLVGVAIPTFSNTIERAEEAVDESHVHTAKTLAAAQYMIDGSTGRVTYYFDPQAGALSDSITGIEGYGKSQVEVNGASGIPNPGGSNPKVLSVKVSEMGQAIQAQWGTIVDRGVTSVEQVSMATDEEREAQDAALLDALQEVFQNMTVGEFAERLGEGANLNNKDFTIALTRARAIGQQTSYNGYKLDNQYIVSGFIDVFKSIGVDTAKVNAKEEYLFTTPGSGNDVRIKVSIGTFDDRRPDLSGIVRDDPNRKMEKAYVYLDSNDAQDKKFSSLYYIERGKTVQ